MIAQVRGTLIENTPLRAVVDVHGVGYELHVPVTTTEKLPALGKEVQLFTKPVYREDSQALYGFSSRDERDFFTLLMEKVSGIGPKTALALLSKLSLPVLQDAISRSDVTMLAKCPGIGKKTAERVCIELRDKVGIGSRGPEPTGPMSDSGPSSATAPATSPIRDAVTALTTLGYTLDSADKAVRKAAGKLGADAAVEDLIREALR